MYITCQECNTTFRLNESLLKPAGSKVRCSQCGNIFIAAPPAPVVSAQPQPTPDQTPASVEGSDQKLAGLDLAELDSLLGPDRSRPATPTAASETVYNPAIEPSPDLDEEDFDIDFETVLESDSRTEGPAPGGAPGDSLEDLEMDFDLENDDTGQIASANRGPEPVAADEFALNLDDVDLTAEADATVFLDNAVLRTPKHDELTLDFEQDAAGSSAAQDVSAADDIPELELDLEDLELDLNGAPEAAAPGAPTEGLKESEADDLLFSDLDDILDEATLGEDAGTRDKFDRKLKSAASTFTDQAQAGTADEDLEELAFELDAEYEDKPISRTEESAGASSTEEDDSEIDLTEIELLLEDDGDDSEQAPAAKSVGRVAPRPSAARDSGPESDGGEIDLSELEAAIDMADTFVGQEPDAGADEELDLAFDSDLTIGDDLDLDLNAPQLTADEQEQELEIESESISDDATAEDELDLTDLEGILADDAPSAKAASLRSGDIELEFQIDDEQTVTSAPIQEQLDTVTPESAPRFERPAAKPAAAAAKLVESRTMPKKKTSSALLIIFILVLLAAIGYGVYYAVTVLGIQIPYISDYLKPSPKDLSGIANLSTLEINSKFMENAQSGRLFVITGKVHNAYPHPREQIRLQGKLFTKGRVLSKTESVYAGNILSDQELVSTPWADIKSRLTTPAPDGNVLSNKSLPFMVVFSNLPAAEDLDEFAVELVSSAPAK